MFTRARRNQMDTHSRVAPSSPPFNVFGVLNLLIALAFGAVAFMGIGSGQPAQAIPCLTLLAPGGLLGASGIMLLYATRDGRPPRAAILMLGAVVSGLFLWVAFMFSQPSVWTVDINTIILAYIPALLAMFLLVEFIYLWRARSAQRVP
jgi:hypothetical protein